MSKHRLAESQTKTFDELARLFHVRREKVIDLVARKNRPLPLPKFVDQENPLQLDRGYRQELMRWIDAEKMRQARTETCSLNLHRIEKELAESKPNKHSREEWSVDETLNDFPPGHFLG